MAALEKRYADEGWVVLAVSVDAKPFNVVENFLSTQNIAHPLLGHDPESQLHKPLSSYGLPVSYLIDRDGVLRYRFDGATDWTQMKHAPYFHEVLKAE